MISVRWPSELNLTSPGESSTSTAKPCRGIRLTSCGMPSTQRTTTVPPVPLPEPVRPAGVAVGPGVGDAAELLVSAGTGSVSVEETARSSGATALRTTCTADQDAPRVRVAATIQPATASGPVRTSPSSTGVRSRRAKPGLSRPELRTARPAGT